MNWQLTRVGLQMPVGNAFGIHLRAARQRSGFSQRQLALKLGATAAYISQWETGTWLPQDKWMATIVAYYPSMAAFQTAAPVTTPDSASTPTNTRDSVDACVGAYQAAARHMTVTRAALLKANDRHHDAKQKLDDAHKRLVAALGPHVKA